MRWNCDYYPMAVNPATVPDIPEMVMESPAVMPVDPLSKIPFLFETGIVIEVEAET